MWCGRVQAAPEFEYALNRVDQQQLTRPCGTRSFFELLPFSRRVMDLLAGYELVRLIWIKAVLVND